MMKKFSKKFLEGNFGQILKGKKLKEFSEASNLNEVPGIFGVQSMT